MCEEVNRVVAIILYPLSSQSDHSQQNQYIIKRNSKENFKKGHQRENSLN